MQVYKNYIIKNIFPTLLMITFSATSLVWITQILKLLYLLDKGIRITDFFNVVILVLPSLLFILLPIIMVMAVIYTYNDLSSGNQIMILQSSGLSNFQLTKPALYVAAWVMLFAYYLSYIALPASYTKLKLNLSLIKNNYISSAIDEKTFNQISKNITLYTDRKLSNGRMQGVIIFDNRDPYNQAILFAKFGELAIYKDDLIFQLNEGIRQIYDKNGNLTKLLFDSLNVKLINNNSLVSDSELNKDINEYYIYELLKPNNNFTKEKKIKLIAEGYQRLLWPLYNVVLPFFALAIFFKKPFNKQSSLIALFYSTLCILVATSLHFTFQNLASKNLNFIFACFGNIIIIMIISSYLFSRKTV